MAAALGVRWQYRRPGYRRVMQYGFGRRRRVMKDLRRGRTLSAEDLRVASAMIDLMQSQRRWLIVLFVLMPSSSLVNGMLQHGFLRWFHFGVVAYCLVILPLILRERRQIIRELRPAERPHHR